MELHGGLVCCNFDARERHAFRRAFDARVCPFGDFGAVRWKTISRTGSAVSCQSYDLSRRSNQLRTGQIASELRPRLRFQTSADERPVHDAVAADIRTA